VSELRPANARPSQATLLAFAGVVLFGGANAIAVKLTVAELAPFWGAAMRFVAAGAILLVLVAATKRPLPRGRSLGGAALYGVVGFAASYGFAYVGLRDVPAGTAMVLIALTPLFTFGLAIAHRQERFHVQGLVGALIAVAGVGLVFVDQLSADVPFGSLLLVLMAAVAIAESSVIVKAIPRSDPFASNAVAMLTGAGLLFVLSLVAGEPFALPRMAETWAAIG
jgi:drug/metabolite transporter (DMT)-like permease